MGLAGGAILASHVIGNTGNQVLDWFDGRKDLNDMPGGSRFQGTLGALTDAGTAFPVGITQQFSNLTGAGRLGTFIGRLTGTFTSGEEGDEHFRRMFERWGEEGLFGVRAYQTRAGLKRVNERNANLTDSIMNAWQLHRKDLEYLDEWTPESFLVSGEEGLVSLRKEFKERNIDYVNALKDARIAASYRIAGVDDPTITIKGK